MPVVDDRALVDVAEPEPDRRDARDDGAGLEDAASGEVFADRGPGMTGARVCRKKVDGLHQSSTPSPIATASDARSSRSASAVRDLDPGERVGEPDADAGQPLELLGEARKPRRAAGDEDLRDRRASRAGPGRTGARRPARARASAARARPRRGRAARADRRRPAHRRPRSSSSLSSAASGRSSPSSRAIAASSFAPPQSRTRMKSQTLPSEIASVERS